MDVKIVYPVEFVKPVEEKQETVNFRYISGGFQGCAEYTHAIRAERGISLEKALEIAANDPNIDYFCYVTAWQLVLNLAPGEYTPSKDPFGFVKNIGYGPHQNYPYAAIFHYGDVLFFKKDDERKYVADAGPYADMYERIYE